MDSSNQMKKYYLVSLNQYLNTLIYTNKMAIIWAFDYMTHELNAVTFPFISNRINICLLTGHWLGL